MGNWEVLRRARYGDLAHVDGEFDQLPVEGTVKDKDLRWVLWHMLRLGRL